MVQSAARKSHILKVGVRSSLVCLSRQYILEAKNQRQPKDARKIARQLLLRNAASTYKAPKTPLMDHKGDSGNAQPAARKSHNLKIVSSILNCRTFCHTKTDWRRKTRANQK